MKYKVSGFTLVEMLVAMTITLLMMAAVARAFAFVGERVRDSRGNLELSSELRDVTTRLNDELRRCTVSLEPNTGGPDQAGYFLYYEGPCTDATTSIFGEIETVDERIVAKDSRYGDLDDYLAFTAVATPGTWFTGQVPTFVLAGVLTGTAADTVPVVIRSRYAEIVYFTNPERDAMGTVIDTDTNGIPDRLLLYRRVLLIRPDLNLTASGSVFNLTGGTDWQTGMAGVHQACDLSVRRQLDADGLATTVVVANSLADLSKPHNRFAHVRVPDSVLAVTDSGGTTIPGTSMPILALEAPLDIISSASTGTPTLRPPNAASGTEPVVLEHRWSGFLRREFVLSVDRQGEDVISNACRGFDIQVFDESARRFLTTNSLVVGPSDAGYREAFFDTTAVDLPGGDFVDLCYPVLAGGAMRGWKAVDVALPTTSGGAGTAGNPGNAVTPAAAYLLAQSQFSGLEFAAAVFPTVAGTKTYNESLVKSGKVLLNGTQVILFQPAFDTFTSSYETDGFLQHRRISGTHFRGSYWRTLAGTAATDIDLGADGLDTVNTTVFPNLPGADDLAERETSPPFTTTPEAIKVSIRLENVGSRQLRQSSVVFRGER